VHQALGALGGRGGRRGLLIGGRRVGLVEQAIQQGREAVVRVVMRVRSQRFFPCDVNAEKCD
jgi:predicted hotdog family 3-hydroxylacyl-ACP dehydratase